MEFYHLAILADSGGELYIPVDKTQAVGIRPLLEKYEVALLLDRALFMSGRHACRSTITAIRYWDEL